MLYHIIVSHIILYYVGLAAPPPGRPLAGQPWGTAREARKRTHTVCSSDAKGDGLRQSAAALCL